MRNRTNAAALVTAFIVVCAIVALEWYSHAGRPNSGAPSAVQAVTAAPGLPSAATPSPTAQPPVVFVPVQTPAPSSSATSAPTYVATAAVPSTPAPLNAGSVVPVQEPVATLAPAAIVPPVVREPANAPPRILAMSLSTPVVRSGETVSGTVETSSNVASVEARIGGYGTAMQKIGVGRFRLQYRVPQLPFFLHRTFVVQIIARNTRGDAVTSSMPITVR